MEKYSKDNKEKVDYVNELAREAGIECEIFHHEATGKTTSDAEKALGLDSRQILKCLLLKSRNNEYIAAIIRGCDRLNFFALESFSGYKGLRMAGNEDIAKELGFEAGGVPAVIFFKKRIRTFVDEKLLDLEYVVGSGGTPHDGMKFNPKDLINKLNYEMVNITLNE